MSGIVAVCVAMPVGVLTTLLASRLLIEQPAAIREPVAQGLGFITAWLSVWPWMKRQPGFPETNWWFRFLGRVKRAGFVGYLLSIVFGFSVIAAVRLYFQTG